MKARLLLVVAASFLVLSGTAHAQKRPAQKPAEKPVEKPAEPAAASGLPRQIGAHDGWIAVDAGTGANRVCYLVGRPTKSDSKPANAKRGEISLTVAHYPGANRTNELTWAAGYPLRDNGPMMIEIGKVKVPLSNLSQPNSEKAWTRDEPGNRQAVDAMRQAAAGANAIVKGISGRGTETTDTFALNGFAKALADIDKACGVKR
ncbi:MAG: hypothetical protein GC202_07830 [Alphaproteobacteria bacterium]|nr:hypothetical protein [Alphaproteobacteria bacterium]